jgi:RNA polymerase subunit RPABC4/transcription elongation factor Spt4
MDLYLGYMSGLNQLPALILTLFIKIIIVIYVYKDSKSYNMGRWFWIALIIILPSYISLIAYLIVRKNNEYTSCPNCQFRVKKKVSICPNCNQILTYACPRCSKIIKKEWDTCPYCTEVLRRKK